MLKEVASETLNVNLENRPNDNPQDVRMFTFVELMSEMRKIAKDWSIVFEEAVYESYQKL